MYGHVPIYHRGVGINFNSRYVVVSATSSNLCIIHCMNLSLHPCPDLSFDRLGLYTFLHSLRSNFSPSRPLQLWFEAAYETSLARDIHAMQSTPKSRRGRYCFICLFCRRGWDKKHGTCLRNGRGCAAYHILHECVVGCPILWSRYEHVPIYH